MFLEKTQVWVSLVVTFAAQIFECIRAWFVLFCPESWQVNLEIGLVILSKLLVVFSFVRSVVLNVLWPLSSIWKCCISPLLTVLVLWDSWIYICALNCDDMTSYVKTPVNKLLSLTTTLDIPYVQLNNCHIQLRWYFDDIEFESNCNVVENIIAFDGEFNYISWNRSVSIL